MGDIIDISKAIVQNGLELKKYKEVMGHEGPAFSCEIWHNGKKAVLVMNDGNGGCNSYHEYEKGIVDLLAEIGRPEADHDPEDHTVTEMLVMLDRKKQMARWAKKGLNYAVEVVFKEIDYDADPPVFEYDARMYAANSAQGMTAGLSRLKKPYKRAHWIKPDGSLGDEYKPPEAPKPVQLDMEAYAKKDRLLQRDIKNFTELLRSPTTGGPIKVIFIPLTATRELDGSITIAGPKYKAVIDAGKVRFDETWLKHGKGNENKELEIRAYISPCIWCGAVANVSTGSTRGGPEMVHHWFKCVNCNKVSNEPID